MKRFVLAAVLMIATIGMFFGADKKNIDPQKVKMVEDFIERGCFIKKIYLNGEIEWRLKGASFFQLCEDKFEYPYATIFERRFYYDFTRWEMSADAKGNLIFTEKSAKGN